MDQVLERLFEVVPDADGLEAQVRPLLELLQAVAGLESAFLTVVDAEGEAQEVRFARNAAPERCQVREGRQLPIDDAEVARELGFATYLSEPVRVGDGERYGTLGAASGERRAVPETARPLLRLFAALAARQVERDLLRARVRAERHAFAPAATSDPMTGLPNRRALTEAVTRALANAARGAHAVVVALADLDGLEQVHERYGHDQADRFVGQVARRWRDGLRDGDLIARVGRREFVVLALATGPDPDADAEALRARVAALATGIFDLGDAKLAYDGPSVGAVASSGVDEDAVALLRRADRAMYATQLARRPKA